MSRSDIYGTFEALLDEHKCILYKICHLYCRNPDDREDLAQEIAVQLWRSFDTFDPRLRFSTWMYRVALNVAISFYRRESVRTRHVVSAVSTRWTPRHRPGGRKRSRTCTGSSKRSNR